MEQKQQKLNESLNLKKTVFKKLIIDPISRSIGQTNGTSVVGRASSAPPTKSVQIEKQYHNIAQNRKIN